MAEDELCYCEPLLDSYDTYDGECGYRGGILCMQWFVINGEDFTNFLPPNATCDETYTQSFITSDTYAMYTDATFWSTLFKGFQTYGVYDTISLPAFPPKSISFYISVNVYGQPIEYFNYITPEISW